jgi:hypothetical protein
MLYIVTEHPLTVKHKGEVFLPFVTPESLTFTVNFLGSFDEIPKTELFFPVEVGSYVRSTVQELPAVTIPQLFVLLNSAALVPVISTEFIIRSDSPLFLIVTVLMADVAPALTVPKLTDAWLAEIMGGLQSPESVTAAMGFLGSFEEMFNVAVFLPNDVAVSVTEIVQELPGETEVQPLSK